MNTSPAARHPQAITVVNGRKTEPEAIDYAYELWAYKHNQSAQAVAEELDLAPRTVQHWAREANWRVRYEEERAEQSPNMARYTTAIILGASAPKAARILDAMFDGIIPYDKTKAYVCQIVLDRVGFAPVNLRDQDHSKKPTHHVEVVDYSVLTDEELFRREAIIGAGRQG